MGNDPHGWVSLEHERLSEVQIYATVAASGVVDIDSSEKTAIIGVDLAAGPGRHFDGIIDEVAVSNLAMESADIQSIMNQGIKQSLGLVQNQNVMYSKRFASLVLACFISVSLYLPAVLAQELSPEDIVVADIKISNFKSKCGDEVRVSEVGLTTKPAVQYATNRGYTIKRMTKEFEGATFIMTSMDDLSRDCITFTVKVPVIVWVTNDKRPGKDENNVAARLREEDGWTVQSDGTLEGGAAKGEIIIETIERDTNIFVVRSKAFPPGKITLGAYGIGGPILLTLDRSFLVVAKTDKLSTTWAELKSK
jgi:hypothetical protein